MLNIHRNLIDVEDGHWYKMCIRDSVMGGGLGIYGIVLGIYLTAGHLAGLVSFGIPYLMPFVKKTSGTNSGEGIWRLPIRRRIFRPGYAREDQSLRLKRKEQS